jgi:hypothetical protein
VLGFPTVIVPVPPLMVGAPATLTFGIQVAPTLVCLAASFAMIVDRSVEVCFRFLNRMLAS